MKKIYSLKKSVLLILISFTIIIPIVIAVLSTLNLYNTKVETLEHNQKQVLQQVQFESNQFINEIDELSTFIKSHYKRESFLLESIVDLNKNVTSIIVLDKKGIIADFYAEKNLNIYKGFDYSNKLYFKNINDNNEYFWSDLFLSTINETVSFSYSFKLNDTVCVIFIKLADLSSFAKSFVNADDTHMIRIYDNDGILILNPDKDYLQAQRVNAIHDSVFVDLINKVKPFTQSSFMDYPSNKLEYGMYSIVNKTGWHIVVRENYNTILSELKDLIIEISVIVLLFIILSIILILKISKRVFSSLDDLENTASSMANGKYNTKIKDSVFKEFNVLINTFKNMQNEIKKREIFLEKSVKSFESLVNSTMEGIILHVNGICFDVNDVTVKLLSYKNKNEIVNKNMIDFVSSEYKELVRSKLKVNSEPYEIKMLKKDGTEFNALIKGKFIDLNGTRVKITTIIDITELKEKDKLLFQQSKMASMGEMIGNIAHQWRQPLSAISTASSGMQTQKEFGLLTDDNFFDSTNLILNSTKYLSRTIEDFRNFFKSEKEMKDFTLNRVIEQSLMIMESSLKSNYINVHIEVKDEILLYGFENELMQVIMNMISNSLDAFLENDLNDKALFISLNRTEKSVIINIKDNAGGIQENIIEKIFEPYFTTKHQSQGTGIGLYMSHQIICNNMNGKIKINNERFKYNDKYYTGANFIIELPLHKQ